MDKKKKSFWFTVAAIACIAVYILIPVLKLAGVIESYNATLTSFLVIAGAVIYMVGRRQDINKEDEVDDPSTHFEETPSLETENIEETKKDGE